MFLLFCCVFCFDFCLSICSSIRPRSIPPLFRPPLSSPFPFFPFYHLYHSPFPLLFIYHFCGLLFIFTFFSWHLSPCRLCPKTDNLLRSPAWHSPLPLASLLASFITLFSIFDHFPRHPHCLCRRVKSQHPAGRYPHCKNRFYGRVIEVERGDEGSVEEERS